MYLCENISPGLFCEIYRAFLDLSALASLFLATDASTLVFDLPSVYTYINVCIYILTELLCGNYKAFLATGPSASLLHLPGVYKCA